MSTGVQITLIICLTIIALFWIVSKYGGDVDSKNNKNKKK